MAQDSCPRGIGVYSEHQKVFLFSHYDGVSGPSEFVIDASRDGLEFHAYLNNAEILLDGGVKRLISEVGHGHVAHVEGQYLYTYVHKTEQGQKLRVATGETISYWNDQSFVPGVVTEGAIVSYYKHNGQYVLYFGGDELGLAYSTDLKTWHIRKTPLLKPRPSKFDKKGLEVALVSDSDDGILVLYWSPEMVSGHTRYAVGAALFSREDPEKLLWRSDKPMIPVVDAFDGREAEPLGLVGRDGMFTSYWNIPGEGVMAIQHPKNKTIKKRMPYKLNKILHNPILSPDPDHFWEAKAVLNPAAFFDNGKIHILYRAQGADDVSVIGYATTSDGVTIDSRSKVPIYMPSQEFEINPGAQVGMTAFGPYISGGAYGGVEDPRITKLDQRYYMTYVAYDGWSPPRVAMSSISQEDFHAKRWNWNTPVLISPPGVVDKNCVILPEKINGKYVIFHRIFPNILVDYVDDLNFDGKTNFLKGEHIIEPRYGGWDSRKVGIGPPPMKTKDGWLTIYHAVDDRDASRYKMGAMLLDLNDPRKVLYRTPAPILEPDQWYENEGLKYGVAYPCGAAIVNDDLFVYYGGADMVVCAARAKVSEFINNMKHNEASQLIPVELPSPVGYYA